MPADGQTRPIHALLVERILYGPGQAPADQRARAFDGAELPAPVGPLLGRVAAASAQITDADFAAAHAAGVGDDQLFELVICAAVGRAAREYEAGLAALAAAEAG